MRLKIAFLIILATSVQIMLQTGCTYISPREDFDAELFLPIISGFEESDGSEYTPNSHAYRISKALEQQYIATSLENIQPWHFCSKKDQERFKDTPEKSFSNPQGPERNRIDIRITKILQPFDWQPLKDKKGVFKISKNGRPHGGVLFGRGVRLSDASLLSLRYVLSPVDAGYYAWSSNGQKIDIPYRYVDFEEIALSDKTIQLFREPAIIYTSESNRFNPACSSSYDPGSCNPKCRVCDGMEVIIDANVEPVSLTDSKDPETPQAKMVKIQATQKTGIWISDASSLSPVLYRSPPEPVKNGWIEVANLSAFPDKAQTAYMDIVRSLTMAQAGNCDLAYTIYKDRIENTQSKNKAQVLAIIAHLHGRSGGDISAVLDDLGRLEGNDELAAKYRSMMEKEN